MTQTLDSRLAEAIKQTEIVLDEVDDLNLEFELEHGRDEEAEHGDREQRDRDQRVPPDHDG